MRADRPVVASLAVGIVVVACRREARRFEEDAWMGGGAAATKVDEAPQVPMPAGEGAGPYRGNAWALGEGQRLFSQMNCVGCHGHGGGGMGVPLMDETWRYGSAPSEVFTSIVDGRPNGMPAFRGRLSDQQVWQLVAYVRALSGLAPKDAAPSRDDHMRVRPSPLSTDPLPIRREDGT